MADQARRPAADQQAMNDETRRKLVEAFEYIQSPPARRAFREILGMALQLGREIRWIPRGDMKYAFRLGKRRPECVACRRWISVYTTSHNPLRVETIGDVLPGIFGPEVAARWREAGIDAEET